jgi:hypothetical protein
MSIAGFGSTTTWDTARAAVPPFMVREAQASYTVRPRARRDFIPLFSQDTTSTDVRFLLGDIGDLFWDSSARTLTWTIQSHLPPQQLLLPRQIEERGPYGGRLITLAEACRLADEALFTAERERQEARERDALDWSDLEDEA